MNDLPFSAEHLLDGFFTACESKFRFLEQSHGMSYLSGIAEYKNNYKIIKPYNPQKLTSAFIAVTRYEREDFAFELQFGADQFAVESYIYYGPINRFTLEEILYAGRKAPSARLSEWGLTEQRLMKEHIERISETVCTHRKLILEPGAKHIERALTVKEKRLEQSVRKKFSDMLKECSKSAAKAYRQKNFRKVVSLLAPYEPYLAYAEKKKLELAKKYLLS